MRSSIDDNESFMESTRSLRFNNPPSDPSTLKQEPVGSSGMQPQEWSRDSCFNNPSSPNDPNTLRGMGSFSSSSSSIVMPPNLRDLGLENPKYVFDMFPISLPVPEQIYLEANLLVTSSKLSLFNKGLALFQWKQEISTDSEGWT